VALEVGLKGGVGFFQLDTFKNYFTLADPPNCLP
jgi:hypothetical protein